MSVTDVAVDMQHALLARARKLSRSTKWQASPISRSPTVRFLATTLEQAVPCYWNWRIVQEADAVAATFPLDAHLLPSDLLAPVQWWYFDNPKLATMSDEQYEVLEAVLLADGALMGAPGEYAITVFCRAKIDEMERPFSVPLPAWTAWVPVQQPWHVGLHLDQLFSLDGLDREAPALAEVVRMVRFVLSSICWLRSTVACSDSVRTSRATRRRLALDMDHQTRVITLRHAEPSGAHDSREVEWACRWAVRAHWRNQAVKEGHRPILIPSYVKGPADKPFRTSTVRYKIDR